MSDKREEYISKEFTSLYESGEIGELHVHADRLASAGDWAGAASAYSKLLQRKPIYEAYSNRGVCYLKLGQYDEAIADFSAALALEPRNPHAYINFNNKGYAYQRKGNHGRAIDEFDQSLRVNVGYAEAYYNRAESLSEMGDFQAAIVSYEDFVRYADPYSFPHHSHLVQEAKKKAARLRTPIEDINGGKDLEEALRVLGGVPHGPRPIRHASDSRINPRPIGLWIGLGILLLLIGYLIWAGASYLGL